jgi:hypothetical protein
MKHKDTPEELNKVAQEVFAYITNPNMNHDEKMVVMEGNCIALGLAADKHDLTVRAVWEIVRKMQDEPITDETRPEKKLAKEEEVFWDFIDEYDLLFAQM